MTAPDTVKQYTVPIFKDGGVAEVNVVLASDHARIVAEKDARIAALLLQAQSWAMEARTQRGTVMEAYQAIGGFKGEPGDWNGAEPMRALVAERDALRTQLADAITHEVEQNKLYGGRAELAAKLADAVETLKAYRGNGANSADRCLKRLGVTGDGNG